MFYINIYIYIYMIDSIYIYIYMAGSDELPFVHSNRIQEKRPSTPPLVQADETDVL